MTGRKIFLTLALAMSGIISSYAQGKIDLGPKSPIRKLQIAEFAINALYVDSLDENKLVENAINGMLKNLDPHSSYSSAKEVKKLTEPLEGSFEGIGIQFNMADDTLLVIQPVSGGPSEKKGILAGDRIVKVNDTIVAGVKMNRDEIVRRLRGPKGSKVKLGIVRRGIAGIQDFTVVRDKIPVNSVDASYMVDKSTGYIRLNNFGATTHDEFTKKIKELREKGMKSLILDLQGNGGGYLSAAVDIANEFLNKDDMIVYTSGRSTKRQDFTAKGNGIYTSGKVLVLVDEYSASAAEILTGAIQDHDRGLVIGRRTFGKGLVQRPISLPDGSMIRLTVSHYYTPSGRCIQKPYSDSYDYAYDIYERYVHGEFTDADSMKVDRSVEYHTAGGRTVYGGGGIIPDLFVPMDTTRATDFFLACNRKATQMRFASAVFDRFKPELSVIDDFGRLQSYLDSLDLEGRFLEYAAKTDGVRPRQGEWAKSKDYMLPQIYALVGRYSKLDDEAFYRLYLPVDETIRAAYDGPVNVWDMLRNSSTAE